MNEIDKLEKLFDERDSVFEGKTSKIFQMVHTCIITITKFFKDINTDTNQGTLEWEEINIMDDLVTIVGVVLYDIGSTIIVEDRETTITEENIDYFQKVIHMTLPLDVILLEEEQISKFLYDMYEQETLDTVTESLDLNNSFDFDLSQLSDKQKQALMQSNIKQLKAKIN